MDSMVPDPNESPTTAEHVRLQEDAARSANWKHWGPYLPERQWGTVREDYSEDGEAWHDFTHAHARSRAYRWGEDGLLGWCDRQCRLCFSVALWNGQDPILKERLYGLTGPEGNHGEDVKEVYHYLDSTPTHSYAKALYRYPQAEFPYDKLLQENQRRGKNDREYELVDTGVFAENRYFDVTIEYAKGSAGDTLMRVTARNCGPDEAELWVMPTFWFRNTWIWGCQHEGCTLKPSITAVGDDRFTTQHETLEALTGAFGPHPDGTDADHMAAGAATPMLFTENETNTQLLYGEKNYTSFVKDAFHRCVVNGETDIVNPAQRGTKATRPYRLLIPAGGERVIETRLTSSEESGSTPFGKAFSRTFSQRKTEADNFYHSVIPAKADDPHRQIARQAYGGLLWTKQFYHYIVSDWLKGDSEVATPPTERLEGRNAEWGHLYARDVLSMPDKWEYPWFAAWDLAFHMLPMARVDPEFAKRQLLVLLREWYMHPNGQLPAYEYAFGDVNPPVHAWACLRVYQMTGSPDGKGKQGKRDHAFLAKAFQRLLLNFTWWVNRVDESDNNVFAGGFLGLDNIGVFDRSKGLPEGTHLEQADGTAWMAFYCGTMLSIALELSREDPAYQEMASKFLDHFVRITDAINMLDGSGLWDDADGFYYDRLHIDGRAEPMCVRSLVGLLPLIAVEILDRDLVDQLPEFRNKLNWFLKYRHDLAHLIAFAEGDDQRGDRLLLAIPSRKKLQRVLAVLFDETEFLSPYGIRSLSKRHLKEPYELSLRGKTHSVSYVPGESDSPMFGGNSNWRGPVWFPVNYLLIEALERYHAYYGDSFKVECPTGSGNWMTLAEASHELNCRLTSLFLPAESGERPCLGGGPSNWQEHPLFHEYFHGDTGEGLGASHQTGWTALVATCIEKTLDSDLSRAADENTPARSASK